MQSDNNEAFFIMLLCNRLKYVITRFFSINDFLQYINK